MPTALLVLMSGLLLASSSISRLAAGIPTSLPLPPRQTADPAVLAGTGAAADPSPGSGKSDKYGSLKIVSTPEGATVILDGEVVGKTPHRVKKLAAGRHTVVLACPRYRRREEKVRVEGGKESLVWAELDPEPGELSITSSPAGAEIWLDGRVIAKGSWSGEVQAGDHEVLVRLIGMAPHEEIVAIPPAGSRELHVLLEKGTDIIVGGPNDPFIRRQDRLFEWPRRAEHEGPKGTPMVLVPAGEFIMGSADSDKQAYAAEKPQRKVRLGAYLIDKFEVPNAMYRRFLELVGGHGHGSCHPSEPEEKDHRPDTMAFFGKEWNQARQPVAEVDWWDAFSFCAWTGKRLPTEAEWEKAARGKDGRVYPWGDEAPGLFQQGNFADKDHLYRLPEWTWIVPGYEDGFAWPAPVGHFPRGASPWGAEDMAGNVAEWVQDWFDEGYYAAAPDVDPRGPREGERRVIRGGSWNDIDWSLRSANRARVGPGSRLPFFGFRCAMDAPRGSAESGFASDDAAPKP
jgi:formylglycine-generating enzyme required for sulfatase activity